MRAGTVCVPPLCTVTACYQRKTIVLTLDVKAYIATSNSSVTSESSGGVTMETTRCTCSYEHLFVLLGESAHHRTLSLALQTAGTKVRGVQRGVQGCVPELAREGRGQVREIHTAAAFFALNF